MSKVMKKVNRNAPCPCGSGKKYKNCHGKTAQGGRSSTIQWIFLLFGIIAVAAFVMISERSPENATQTRGGYTPPPGPAPPGKVWSSEHGHWHDAPGTAGTSSQPTNPAQSARQPVPQPPGPVPPGKVWSSEHGHWHDEQPDPATGQAAQTTPQRNQ